MYIFLNLFGMMMIDFIGKVRQIIKTDQINS